MNQTPKKPISPRIRVRSVVDRISAQGGSVIYQQQALYPVLEIVVRIREKSREQLGDFESHILRFAGHGVSDQAEFAFVTGFPEEKLVPILHELSGRGLLSQDSMHATKFMLSELGKLTIAHGAEVLETDRVILLCGLSGRLVPRELYLMPTIDPSQLRGSRFVPDLIRESSEITLSLLNLGCIPNKRAVNLPEEAIEICGVLAQSEKPKFLECEILLFKLGVETKVELHFSYGKVDWLSASEVLGLLEPLGYPTSSPVQIVRALAEELKRIGLVLDGQGELDSNSNPVFTLSGCDDRFFEQKVAGRLYPLHVAAGSLLARPVPGFPRILRGRTLSLLAKTGSTLERDIIILRLIDQVITERKIKRQSNPDQLFEALSTRTSETVFSFEEIQKVAFRTKDETFIAAITGQSAV